MQRKVEGIKYCDIVPKSFMAKYVAGIDKRVLVEVRDILVGDLNTLERKYEQMTGRKFMKKAEFKFYDTSLCGTSAKSQRLTSRISDLRHEEAVLRTRQPPQVKEPTPAGPRETEAVLEKASAEKSRVDRAKGKTPDEISAIVSKEMRSVNKVADDVRQLKSYVFEAERN